MKQHLRIDTFKVFPEDDNHLQAIIEDNKLSRTQGKSKAYRIALERYQEHKQLHQEVATLNEKIAALTEQIGQLYFLVQGGVK